MRNGRDWTKIFRDIDQDFSATSAEILRELFLKHGCVVVRQALDRELLARLRDGVDRAFAQKPGPHVYTNEIKAAAGVSPFALTSGAKFRAFLALVYQRQLFLRMNAAARRIQGTARNRDWQEPLALHLDAQFHRRRFTVNFWVPLEDCGIDRPALQVVPVDYLSTRQYAGYTGRRLNQSETANMSFFDNDALALERVEAAFGPGCCLRPEMRAGDLIIASNWLLHGTYWAPGMDDGRTSLEIRFIGSDLDIHPWLPPIARRLPAVVGLDGPWFTTPAAAGRHAPRA